MSVTNHNRSLGHQQPFCSRRFGTDFFKRSQTWWCLYLTRGSRCDELSIIGHDLLAHTHDGKLVARLTNYLDVFRTEHDGKNTGFAFYATEEVEQSIHRHLNWHDYFWTLIKEEFPATTDGNVTFRYGAC